MSTPPPLLAQWIADGCPSTSTFVLGSVAECILALGEAPPGPDPKWPAPIAEAISQTNATAPLGSVNWSWLAAFEATGTPRHPSIDRMLGALLLKPATRAAYIAAVRRLSSLLDSRS